MARALIVGCGCRGRQLGTALLASGWQVRGTARSAEGLARIEDAGLEGAIADPDRPGTILDQVHDVTVLAWLLGSAQGEPGQVAAIHGPRLERLLEKLVDTPVRGFVYEAAGSAPQDHLDGGMELVRRAAATWRIPVEVVADDPVDPQAWTAAMVAAAERLLA
jgi:nucleoside-diphosphate-sugar epimerase